MALARSPDRNPGTRVDVSVIDGRNEPVLTSQWGQAIPMSNCVHSRAHPPTLVHARLLDIRWTPSGEFVLTH